MSVVVERRRGRERGRVGRLNLDLKFFNAFETLEHLIGKTRFKGLLDDRCRLGCVEHFSSNVLFEILVAIWKIPTAKCLLSPTASPKEPDHLT